MMMEFEWDERKNEANFRKHGISFEEAIPAFYDGYRLDFEDTSTEEERYKLIGRASKGVLLVVYRFQEDRGLLKIRVISARKVTKNEQKQYQEYHR